jgi:hypothetical protein
MRSFGEIEHLRESGTIEKAAQSVISQLGNRVGSSSMGTIASQPTALAPRARYNEEGDLIEFWRCGDAVGSKPLG